MATGVVSRTKPPWPPPFLALFFEIKLKKQVSRIPPKSGSACGRELLISENHCMRSGEGDNQWS